jgi:uncharacterized protein YcfL
MLLVFGMLLGCDSHLKNVDNKQQELVSILKASIESIYLAKGGLEYPHSKQTLDACVQSNDKPCLDAFHHVKAAKTTVASLSDKRALDATLDIIEETCLSEDDTTANFTCYGGIMSLYFYRSPEQDAKILTRVKNYPQKIRNMIFNNQFYWYHNRPNVNLWIDYIATAGVDWKYDVQKQYVSDLFKKGIEEVDGPNEPWVNR